MFDPMQTIGLRIVTSDNVSFSLDSFRLTWTRFLRQTCWSTNLWPDDNDSLTLTGDQNRPAYNSMFLQWCRDGLV